MPTARELLEQADALMRRNRNPAIDDIPVLTDSVPTITEALLTRELVQEEAVPARTLSDPIPTLTDRVESSTAGAADAVMMEGDPSDWLDFDQAQPSIIGEAPDSIAIVPPVELARDLDDALLESAEHEEIELTSRVEEDFDQELEARAAEPAIAPAPAAPPANIVLPGVVPSAAALAAAIEEAALAHPVLPVGEPPATPAEPAESAAAPPESAPTRALATPHAFATPRAFVTPQVFATPRAFAPAPVSPVVERDIVPTVEPQQASEVDAAPMPAPTSEPESFFAPEPESFRKPGPELVSTPESESAATSEFESLSALEPESFPTPESESFPTPESESFPTPESESFPTPESESFPTPESEDSATPESEASATPESEASAAPESEASAAPESEASATPEPEASAMPEPETSATPEPETSATPEPETSATPEVAQAENVAATSSPWDDQARWDMAAEEIRMQVLQRIDLFTDTGLREQLGSRLKPIVDRASADLVATINQHVGELLRAYVAEAIEREIEQWRETNVPKS